jgi:hypothetical protein
MMELGRAGDPTASVRTTVMLRALAMLAIATITRASRSDLVILRIL